MVERPETGKFMHHQQHCMLLLFDFASTCFVSRSADEFRRSIVEVWEKGQNQTMDNRWPRERGGPQVALAALEIIILPPPCSGVSCSPRMQAAGCRRLRLQLPECALTDALTRLRIPHGGASS